MARVSYLDRPQLSLWVRIGRWSTRSAVVTTRIDELTSTTATVDLDNFSASLKLGQTVRARIGTASTTAIVTGVQPNRVSAESRYELKFVNTTPAFRDEISDGISALTADTVVPLMNAA